MSAAATLRPGAVSRAAMESAFIASCRDEIEALKPGNVHVHAAGHGMTVDQFLQSAEASAAPLCAPGAPVGARILAAVRASFTRVGLNTNLGIVLLCAPLAAAAEKAPAAPAETRAGAEAALRAALETLLRALDLADAQAGFEAIRIASPGGLGSAPRHDARAPATTSLLEAMRAAQERDMIARQYARGFAEIFGSGLPALQAAREKGVRAPWLASAVHIEFLGCFDDSHVARKFGPEAARGLRERAAPWREKFCASRNPAEFNDELLAFDASLKSAGLNPGTSADLTVATLFADRLIDLIARGNND